jgi:hypothetical protein
MQSGRSVSGAGAASAPRFTGLPTFGTDQRLYTIPSSTPTITPTDTPTSTPTGTALAKNDAAQTNNWAQPLTYQREKNVSLAISPVNPNFMVGGYDVLGYDDNHSRFVRSTDGGYSWQGGNFSSRYFGDLEMIYDSLVAFDSQGTAYYTALGIGSNTSGYLVFTSTDGLNWSRPSPIVIADYNEYRYLADLAIDQRTSGQYAGSLYFASPYYHNIPPYDQGLHLRYSRDNGVTWSQDVIVSDPQNQYNYRPSIGIASDGTVYVGFTDVISGSILNPPQLFLDRSTDGGQTWGTDRLITGAPITPIGAPDWKFHELTLAGSADCDLLRINHNPIIGVSPTNPNEVYVVWNDGRWDLTETVCSRPNARHSDIAFSRTTDGGVTWSAPIRINDDPQGNGIDQWQPSMRVASDGTIGVTWYDRRWSADHYYYDLAYGQSTDGGLTWSPNQRVSDQSSNPTALQDVKGIDDLGFRKDMVFGPNFIMPAWIDARDGSSQGHLYIDHGIFGAGTPIPSPTATSTSPPSPTGTATATQPATAIPSAIPTATACAITFTDVPPGSTFYSYVHCLACLGIINGYPDGTFKPNANVTRGQLSKIVSNSAGFNDPQTTQMFQDVPVGSTFFQYIGRLASRGYISGYPCGGPGEPCQPGNLPYFRPNANATRGQISKIVSNAANFNDPPSGQQFEDVGVGSTFYTYTFRLVSRGVMSGYPCGGVGEPCVPPANLPYFRPNNNATRGQTSKIVANTFFPGCNIRVGR